MRQILFSSIALLLLNVATAVTYAADDGTTSVRSVPVQNVVYRRGFRGYGYYGAYRPYGVYARPYYGYGGGSGYYGNGGWGPRSYGYGGGPYYARGWY